MGCARVDGGHNEDPEDRPQHLTGRICCFQAVGKAGESSEPFMVGRQKTSFSEP